MNTIQLYPGMGLVPSAEGGVISQSARILFICIEADSVGLINVEPKKSAGRTYFTGPFVRSLQEIQGQLNLNSPRLIVTTIKSRPDATASADELDKKYRRDGQKQSYPRQERRRRWRLILPLIKGTEGNLLFDTQVRKEKVSLRAQQLASDPNDCKEVHRIRREIQNTLNQYWAGGSTRGALTPLTSACGGRGKPKTAKSKLGRKNNLTKRGVQNADGFIVAEKDKEIIQYCWRNFLNSETTEAAACRKMWREFYSVLETDASGRANQVLLPATQRPSQAQFRSWGQKQSPDQAAWRKQLSSSIARMMDRAMLGSANQGVCAIGQRGSIDSTSPDIKFVAADFRIDRIGPAYRILIVDALHGYIPGFYLGLEPASSETVKLAILNAMSPKQSWLKWLGLDEQDIANWIPIHFTSFIADNTDARAERVFVALDAIGSGSLYVPVARSDLNSLSEVGHHQLHRLVDHKMLGTTHGRMRTERGEESADSKARHTIVEAIKETARAIYAHNTIPLDLEPTSEMRRELLDKGIPVTRASLTALSIRQGRVARALMDIDEARIHLMPITRGTFTREGVYLLRPGTGKNRKFIKSVIYCSSHKAMLAKFRDAAANRGGRDVEKYDADFRYNPYDPTTIYYRDSNSGELITLNGRSKDRELLGESVYADITARQDQYDSERPDIKDKRDRIISDMEYHQELTKEQAEMEYQEDIHTLEAPPSKSALIANKTQNREREEQNYVHGMPTILTYEVSEDENFGVQASNSTAPTAPSVTQEAPETPASDFVQPKPSPNPQTKSIFSKIVREQLR